MIFSLARFRKPAAAGRHFPGARNARRLVIFTEHFNATYFISFEIPLTRLVEQGAIAFSAYSQADVQAAPARQWERWILQERPRAVVLTRFGRPEGVDIVAFCRAQGIPVVYHIDDDLLELPDSLGADVVKRHSQDGTVDARRAMLAACDLVYASTPVLARVLQERFPQQRVFHGIYAPYLPEVLPALPTQEGDEVIGYMGSKGHREDLELVLPALVRLMRERPGLRFETFGTIGMPAELEQFGRRARHHAVQKSYAEFLKTLAGLRWRVGLAPLVDAPFNRCKAPTKFIEYSSCGIPTAASDVVVYANAMPADGGELVRDDWHGAISRLLDQPGHGRACVEAARAHCARVYSLENLAAQVTHVMDLVATAAPGRAHQA